MSDKMDYAAVECEARQIGHFMVASHEHSAGETPRNLVTTMFIFLGKREMRPGWLYWYGSLARH